MHACMQVEVKIRLPDKAAYDKVAASLGSARGASYDQENYFFDGANRELNERRVVLRVRIYDAGKKATLTLKVRACWPMPAPPPPGKPLPE